MEPALIWMYSFKEDSKIIYTLPTETFAPWDTANTCQTIFNRILEVFEIEASSVHEVLVSQTRGYEIAGIQSL